MTDSLARLSAALANRYRVERELGAGGMATVYLAEDLKHHRRVALKVLRPDLSAVLGTERFLKEIEVTANLQHPNILPLFDSGEADSLLYYVMPHVEGETLRARLTRERQLALDEAIGIARAVAAALDYAHRHGVIHRDIKPENILLSEGQTLVADFGIALAVSQAAGTRLTETAVSLGTPQYMSPEQATGDQSLDARSDVYSLGCVVYEMLAGEPPYSGPSAQSILAKMLTGSPSPLSTLRDAVPRHMEEAVHRALARAPADRFATAREFSEALADSSLPSQNQVSVRSATEQDRRPHGRKVPLTWIAASASILLIAFVASWLLVKSATREPPRVVMMDSPHPARVYDPETLAASGTNADVISDLLLDLPIQRLKESIGPTWHRDEEVRRLDPALIIIHYSGFCQETCDERRARLRRFIEFFADARTIFLIYSRQPGDSLARRMELVVADLVAAYPDLQARIQTFGVIDYGPPRWRDPTTAGALKLRVMHILRIRT